MNNNTVFLTPQQFVNALMEQKGTTAVSFQATTDAKLKKTGNLFAMPVIKVSEVNGMIGYDYENSVNNQKEREGQEREFQVAKRSWGERIHPCVVTHKGQFYITVKIQRVLSSPLYIDFSGKELESIEVKPFLPAKSKSRQGVENEVIHREYKVESIRNIRWKGKVIQIINPIK